MRLVRLSNSYPNRLHRVLTNEMMDFSHHSSHLSERDLPSANIREYKDSFSIEMATPGLKKEDLKIELDNQLLSISFESAENDENKEETLIRREFRKKSFKRSFTLGDSIDVEKIEAKYENGLLQLTLQKKEEAKPKAKVAIDIN